MGILVRTYSRVVLDMSQSIYFVRHGESEFNRDKLFAGRSESPLTDLGRQQAEAAAANMVEQQIEPEAIVSSPLSRAYETAQIIAKRLNYPETRIISEPLFAERSFGVLEGTSRDEFFNAYSYQDIDNAPNAETLERLQERATKAVTYLKTLPAQHLLVVSHSGFYRAFYRALQQDAFIQEYTTPFGSIKNGKVYQLS